MNHQLDTNNKNIIIGPDYEQLSKQQTNSAIIAGFVAYLFAPDTKMNFKYLWKILRTLAIILTVKTIIEDSKSHLDKFKFTNLNFIKYMYQNFKYSEIKYDIIQITGKWTYDGKNMSSNTLIPFLESKCVYVNQHDTYYYPYRTFLIKVIVINNKITFCVPNVGTVNIMMIELLTNHQEKLFGSKTQMFNAIINPTGDIMQFIPMSPIYVFETDNYIKLYNRTKTLIAVDAKLKFRKTPLIVNFDGPHGTGKTSYASYIAEKGIFDRIILYNMVQSNMDFKTMLNKFELILTQQAPKDRKSDINPEEILIIFDEIDKWFNSYCEKIIDDYRNESRKKMETKTGQDSTVIESFTKLTVEEESDKKKQLQMDFLDKLYRLCEGLTLKTDKKYVIIFNTNDFDSLFVGSGKKYFALNDRFQKYEFTNVDKTGVIKYFEGIKQSLVNTPDIDTIINFDSENYNLIPDNISISYRTLSKQLIDNCFDIMKTINSLKPNIPLMEYQNIIDTF